MLYDRLQKDLFLISGPCVIESEDLCLRLAEHLKAMAAKLGYTYIFKASFDKANRTSVDAYRGPGLEEGLRILEKVKRSLEVFVTTDIHESYQAKPAGEVVDILQIPAFLCRQTDLLVEAGKTGKVVNIKKGQFLSGKDMEHPPKKVQSTGNSQLLLTDRGNFYGNNNLVVDYRNLADMQKFGFPVVLDVTHSTQRPGGEGGKSGGNPEYAPSLAKAAAAIGVRGFFFETHFNPKEALSDGANMIQLDVLEQTLEKIKNISQWV